MPLSIDDFRVVADERNCEPVILDSDRMKVDVLFKDGPYVNFLIDRNGRVIEINGVNVEDILYVQSDS